EKQPIGDYLTQQGRPIFWLKIGNNPDIDEDKPAILYNSLHHAREPNSLAQLLFFMWHLLENYESDAEIKYLVDNVAMYFIPCVNPDGYVYNERTSPQGGGLWRKNRSVNSQGDTVGVDLNRNYGFEWGLDDVGSSSNQLSEVYRGPSPFSEPETQALRDFCVKHQFKIALNYHSFSNLLIIPWGFDSELTPDDATYRALAQKMTEQNNYTIGTGLETVGYLVNGDSDDWMYGEQTTKPKIFSMTPEVGPQIFGFWPPQNAIDQLNKDNVWQNISAAALLKSYGTINDLSPGMLDKATGTLTFNLQNIGLEAGDFTVTVQSTNENVMITSNPFTVNLAALSTNEFLVDYAVINNDQVVRDISFEVIINNGAVERKEIITKRYFGAAFESAFIETVSANLDNWSATGNWGTTTTTFFSENHSITDSPNGNYRNNLTSRIRLREAVDLTDAAAAVVKFRGRWALESGFDYVQLQVRAGSGNYEPLCGKFTVLNGDGEPAYNGFQDEWVLEEIDISDYVGQQVTFQFELRSDDFVNEDGFYFDDFTVAIIDKDAMITSTEEPTIFAPNGLQITPNPFSDNLVIDFNLLEKTTDLSIQLLNALGQNIAIQPIGNLSAGKHTYEWRNLELNHGFYFVKIQTAEGSFITKKILRIAE
ncbi:MAG: M14 family zinc carboxypeptidase, partial [Bacteroidota bacterium]